MKYRLLFTVILMAGVLCCFGKYDGGYLRQLTMEYETPHLDWGKNPEGKRLRGLFIVPRDGAREVVELLQRMTMDYAGFVVYNHNTVAQESVYEAAIDGTGANEKKLELLELLKKDYDLIVIGNYNLTRLPEEAQFRILSKLRDGGTGLLLVNPAKTARLPYRKLYQNPLSRPHFFEEFDIREIPGNQAEADKMFQAWQVGKGRFAEISFHGRRGEGVSLSPNVLYNHFWQAGYENTMAFLARSVWWIGVGDRDCGFTCPELAANPEISNSGAEFQLNLTGRAKPFFRIRDLDNRIVAESEAVGGKVRIPGLPAGKYFCDIFLKKGDKTAAFGLYSFRMASPFGKLTISAPESVQDRQGFGGVLTWEKAAEKPLTMMLELMDSPYNRVWYRDLINIPAGQQRMEWRINGYYLPTPAGYVRVRLLDKDNNVLDWTEQLVFFPDYRLDGYFQMGWSTLPLTTGALMEPQLVGRQGYGLGLTHPRKEGENARIVTMLNQRFVSYTVRIGLQKTKEAAVKQYRWFFLPPELQKEVKELNGDESFYRPEVQKLWRSGIEYRLKNLPKYGPAIYSLGDENFFNTDGAYGPSDTQYFREFLEGKYRTIDKLNQEWKSTYTSFSEVPHLPQKEAKDSGNFAAWFDHQQYAEKMYADLHHFLAEEIRKIDPRARVGAEGSRPGELELTIEKLDFWGPYSNLVNDEALRSLGGDKTRTLWWGGFIGMHGGRNGFPLPLLGSVLKGTVNGSAWYSTSVHDISTMLAVDYSLADYVKQIQPYTDMLQWGQADLLQKVPLADSGIMIYWSHPSATARLLDERCSNPNDSLTPLIKYFYQTGHGFEFVSSRTLERLKKGKVLFMCGTSAISDEEVLAILDFARNGGTVIADINPGMLNNYLRPLERNPLRELFGDIVFEQLKPIQLYPVSVNTVFNQERLRFEADKCLAGNDKSFVEIRKYGKGHAILLNFSLTSAENTASPDTPFNRFMGKMLSGAGVKPVYRFSESDRNTVIRIRNGNGFDIAGILLPISKLGGTVQIDMPEEFHVYECSKGYVGKYRKFDALFQNTPYRVFALFRERQNVPVVKFAKEVNIRGTAALMELEKLSKGRVYSMHLIDPKGNEHYNRRIIFDTGKVTGQLAVHLAYNDMPGRWQVMVHDVATGLKSTLVLNVE